MSDARESAVEAAITKTWGKDAAKPAGAPKETARAKPASKPATTPAKPAASRQAPAAAATPSAVPAEADGGVLGDGSGDGALDAAESVPGEAGEAGPGDEGNTESDGAVPESAKTYLAGLIESGKVNEAFLAAFGKPLTWFKVDDSKFVALKRARKQFDDKAQEVASQLVEREKKLEEGKAAVTAKYEPMHQLAVKGQSGDVVATVELCAKACNMEPEEVVRAYIKGIKSLDRPLHKRVEQVEQKLSAPPRPAPAAPAAAPAPATPDANKQAEAVAAATKHLTDTLAEHPVAKIKGYGAKVLTVMQAHYQKTGQRMQPQQAAAAVIENRRKELEQDKWLLEGGQTPETPPARRTSSRRAAPNGSGDETPRSRDELVSRAAEKFFGRAPQ